MSERIYRAQWNRLIFFIIFCSPFCALAIWAASAGHGMAWLLTIPFIGGLCTLMHVLLSRIEEFAVSSAHHIIEVDGPLLRQIDDSGVTIGELDLSAPLQVRYKYYAFGHATYSVIAGATTIRFTTHLEDARILVCDVLRQSEWPPGGDSGG